MAGERITRPATRGGPRRATTTHAGAKRPSREARARSDSGLFVGSVEKAFEILGLLSAAPGPMGLSDVARVSAMGKSAAQRFLHTLAALGYIDQDPETKAYALSTRILDLARPYLGADGIREKSIPFLRAANMETEETVNLTLPDRLSVVYLMRYPGFHEISVDLSIGSRLPAFCTAPGKVLLAHMQEAEARRVLAKSDIRPYTPHTILDPGRILRSFPEIRRRGYYLSDQEAFVGDLSVAAPVFNFAGRVVAAVNIAVPVSRWTLGEVQRRLMPVAVTTARGISGALGFAGARS